VAVGDLHATVMKAVGVDWTKTQQTRIRRTVRRADGEPIPGLLT
jgi:hypothetical protein